MQVIPDRVGMKQKSQQGVEFLSFCDNAFSRVDDRHETKSGGCTVFELEFCNKVVLLIGMKLKSRGCTVFEMEFVIMLLAVSMLSMKQSQEGVPFLSWSL